MKFEFDLKGKDWIVLWGAVLVFYFCPCIWMQFISKTLEANPGNFGALGLLFVLLAVMLLSILILLTPILKKFINNTKLDGVSLNYTGKIAGFVFLNIGNLLLTIITIGIYGPWYAKKVIVYVAENTRYKDTQFGFNGKGLHLLGLLAATLIVPLILWSVCFSFMLKPPHANLFITILSTVFLYLLLVPYIYFIYKWVVNFSYKDYIIKWNTEPAPSILFIAKQFLLTVVTAGIYFPVAFAKAYEYFIGKTVFEKSTISLYSLSAKFDYFKLWKTIWGQVLLSIFTLGIYGAWAYCNIFRLFASKTSVEETA